MKKILLILMCLNLAGCAVISKKKLESQIIELQGSLFKKDEEIKRLQDLLKENERLLREKDFKLESLRKKLESFGAFE